MDPNLPQNPPAPPLPPIPPLPLRTSPDFPQENQQARPNPVVATPQPVRPLAERVDVDHGSGERTTGATVSNVLPETPSIHPSSPKSAPVGIVSPNPSANEAGSSTPKKSKKLIAGIIGLVVLISALAGGFYAVGRQQLFQPKAAGDETCRDICAGGSSCEGCHIAGPDGATADMHHFVCDGIVPDPVQFCGFVNGEEVFNGVTHKRDFLGRDCGMEQIDASDGSSTGFASIIYDVPCTEPEPTSTPTPTPTSTPVPTSTPTLPPAAITLSGKTYCHVKYTGVAQAIGNIPIKLYFVGGNTTVATSDPSTGTWSAVKSESDWHDSLRPDGGSNYPYASQTDDFTGIDNGIDCHDSNIEGISFNGDNSAIIETTPGCLHRSIGIQEVNFDLGYCLVVTPTPTPTLPAATPTLPPGVVAQCTNILVQKLVGTAWQDITDPATQANIGDQLRFLVTGSTNSGSFTKAAFFINHGLPIVDTTPADGFSTDYTLIAGPLTVEAVLYHSTEGWVDTVTVTPTPGSDG